MADDTDRKPRYVVLLPPLTKDRQVPAARKDNPPAEPWEKPDHWLPSSLARRVLNKVLAKEAASQAELLAQINRVGILRIEYLRIREEFQLRLARSEALPALRNAATAQAYDEVVQIFEKIDDERDARRLERLRRSAEIIKAEREVADLMRGPPPAPPPALPPPPKESRGKSKAAAIKRVQEERDEIISVILAGRSEADLDEEDRKNVEDCRLAAAKKIQEILWDA